MGGLVAISLEQKQEPDDAESHHQALGDHGNETVLKS